MKVIQKKNIKYIKLCLISPIFEIVTNIIYLTSFLILAFLYTNIGRNYNNNEISRITELYLLKSQFTLIKSDTDYINYLKTILQKLYTYNKDTDSLPFLVPSGSVRLTKYAYKGCSESIDFTKNCNNNYKCIITTLQDVFDNKNCGIPKKKKKNRDDGGPLKKLVPNFPGKYTSYNLLNGGEYMDITIDDFDDPTELETFIKDYDLNFLVLQINFEIPANDNNVNAIIGIEMLNYYTNINYYFSVTPFNTYRAKYLLFVTTFIFFTIVVFLNIVKLIYEINVKLIWSVHIFVFLNEVLDVFLIIFTIFFISEGKSVEFHKPDNFYSPLAFLSIRKFIIAVLCYIMICFPFRFISLISWANSISGVFVKYISILFRMLPGMIIIFFVFGMVFAMFGLANYSLYNEMVYEYSTLYNSFLSIWDTTIISDMIHPRDSKIFHNLSVSEYFILINIFEYIVSFFLIAIGTATIVYLYKRASVLEMDKVENEIMIKLKQIEEKLEEGKETEDNDLRRLKKQILWLNLSNKHELYNHYSSISDLLLFKTSNQIISSLKYLFAIKPELQFKKLNNKFGIIIEIKNEKSHLKEEELDQIDILIDWLTFVGCKIPVALYSQINIEKTLKMKLHSSYQYIKFINDQREIDSFIVENNKEMSLIHENKFTIICENENPPEKKKVSVLNLLDNSKTNNDQSNNSFQSNSSKSDNSSSHSSSSKSSKSSKSSHSSNEKNNSHASLVD